MTDSTAPVRREMFETGQPAADLAADEGQRWTTEELTRDFEVIGFAAPFAVVRRRSDGQRGSLEFTHSPRVYFGWQPTREVTLHEQDDREADRHPGGPRPFSQM